MPKISVIVPVYKVEAYLEKCVQSILSQPFSDFELILVDDGSPDNCPVMCDEYAKSDRRVVVLHQPNGGLSAARNAALDWAFVNSDSEWVTFIDSDDWVHAAYLERLYCAANDHHVAVAVSRFRRTRGEDPFEQRDMDNVTVISPEEFYVADRVTAIIACGKLYKKECFQSIRFPVGALHEDEFVTYQVLFRSAKIAVLEEPLYAYFINDQGIMRSENVLRKMAVLKAFEEQKTFFKEHGFDKALTCHLKNEMRVLLSFYDVLRTACASSEKTKESIRAKKQVTRRLRKLLHYFIRKKTDITRYEKDRCMSAVYPTLSKVIWKLDLK